MKIVVDKGKLIGIFYTQDSFNCSLRNHSKFNFLLIQQREAIHSSINFSKNAPYLSLKKEAKKLKN